MWFDLLIIYHFINLFFIKLFFWNKYSLYICFFIWVNCFRKSSWQFLTDNTSLLMVRFRFKVCFNIYYFLALTSLFSRRRNSSSVINWTWSLRTSLCIQTFEFWLNIECVIIVTNFPNIGLPMHSLTFLELFWGILNTAHIQILRKVY